MYQIQTVNMKTILRFLPIGLVFLIFVSFTKASGSNEKSIVKYYYATGQNTSLKKTYRSTSNVFSLDCERVDFSTIGGKFSDYYKKEYSQSTTDYITGFCYGPFPTYQEAEKNRQKRIDDQNYLCKSPDCVVTLAQGFTPSCR